MCHVGWRRRTPRHHHRRLLLPHLFWEEKIILSRQILTPGLGRTGNGGEEEAEVGASSMAVKTGQKEEALAARGPVSQVLYASWGVETWQTEEQKDGEGKRQPARVGLVGEEAHTVRVMEVCVPRTTEDDTYWEEDAEERTTLLRIRGEGGSPKIFKLFIYRVRYSCSFLCKSEVALTES